jgi:MOSC domain-containing protein YiiM
MGRVDCLLDLGLRFYCQLGLTMRLVSVQLGMPQTYGDPASSLAMEKEWTTGFYKTPTANSVNVTPLGVEGDGVADHKHHGGIDKAVLAYSADRYGYWREKLKASDAASASNRSEEIGREEIGPGGFGENLTIAGWDESSVCIGDQFEIGTTILEVSQPREPCWKLGRRWQEKMLPKYVAQCGYTGWYFRVARAGQLKAGDEVSLVQRPNPTWSVERANDVLYGRIVDASIMAELYLLPELSAAWKKSLG